MERITKDDVLKITPGSIKSFGLSDNAACNAAKVCVQYVKRICRDKMAAKGIADYKTNVNWEQSIVTIQAVAV